MKLELKWLADARGRLNWTKITIKLKINLKSMQKCEKKTIRRSSKYLRLFSWCDLILFFFLKVIFSHIVSFNSVLTAGDTRCTYTQTDTHTGRRAKHISLILFLNLKSPPQMRRIFYSENFNFFEFLFFLFSSSSFLLSKLNIPRVWDLK